MNIFGIRKTVTRAGRDSNWTEAPPETQIPERKPDFVEGFKAELMSLVLKYRAMAGKNIFDPFHAEVQAAVARFQAKGLPLDVMREIDRVADSAIVRARTYGISAFEPGNN